MDNNEPSMTLTKAASAAGCCERTILRRIHGGHMRGYKDGKEWRVGSGEIARAREAFVPGQRPARQYARLPNGRFANGLALSTPNVTAKDSDRVAGKQLRTKADTDSAASSPSRSTGKEGIWPRWRFHFPIEPEVAIL
jgi:hypothetical protein